MKVCHIISGDQWAGAEVMVYNLLKGLREYKGVELYAILFNDGKVSKKLKEIGISVQIVDEKIYNIFQIINKTRDILRKILPNIIHSHRQKENVVAYYSSCSMRNVERFCTQHGMPEPLNNIKKELRRFVLTKFHHYILSNHFKCIVVVSKNMRSCYIKKFGFKESGVVLIHNGTEIPKTQKSFCEKNIFVIGSAGRLFPVKDYPLMVNIAKETAARGKNIRFVLAGEGPDMDMIAGMVRGYGIGDRFNLAGFINDTARFYEGLDLYLNTSIHEGIPMSILEAMAKGIPVVAPDVGGIREIIDDGIHGYLVKDRDPKSFCDKCIKIYEDRGLQKIMGVAARERVIERFSLVSMVKNYHNLYLGG